MPVLFEETHNSPKIPSQKKRGEESSSASLMTYAFHPKGIKFETQTEEEEIILFLRQHIIVLVPQIFFLVFLMFSPVVLFPFMIRFFSSSLFSVPSGYIVVGTVFWYIVTFGYGLTQFLHWFFNIFIVSNKRVIDIEFVNLLYKEFSEAQIERIQDISYHSHGIMATFFNYGDVTIQTAGEQENFIFESVPRPSEVVKVISGLLKKGKTL